MKAVKTTLDTNVLNAVSDPIDLYDVTYGFMIQPVASSGAHTTHVVTVQFSNDNINWFTDPAAALATLPQLTARGHNGYAVMSRFMRLKVTTAEGGASETVYWVSLK